MMNSAHGQLDLQAKIELFSTQGFTKSHTVEIFAIHLLGLGVYFWKDTFMLEGLQNRTSVFKCPRTV